MPEPRQIIVISKNEPAPRSFWGNVERVSKAVAIAAVPILLAIIGFIVQESSHKDTLGKEYLDLAIKVLADNGASKTNSNPQMQAWAKAVFARYSPVPVPLEPQIVLPAASSTGSYAEALRELSRLIEQSAVPTNSPTGDSKGASVKRK
jgi:hypothetical protein